MPILSTRTIRATKKSRSKRYGSFGLPPPLGSTSCDAWKTPESLDFVRSLPDGTPLSVYFQENKRVQLQRYSHCGPLSRRLEAKDTKFNEDSSHSESRNVRRFALDSFRTARSDGSRRVCAEGRLPRRLLRRVIRCERTSGLFIALAKTR